MKRLNEIYYQQLGSRVVDDPDIIAELKITDEQKTKIATVRTENQEAMRTFLQELRGGAAGNAGNAGNAGGGGRGGGFQPLTDEQRAKMTEATEKNDEKIYAVLTEAQRTKLGELKGKEFAMPEGELSVAAAAPAAARAALPAVAGAATIRRIPTRSSLRTTDKPEPRFAKSGALLCADSLYPQHHANRRRQRRRPAVGRFQDQVQRLAGCVLRNLQRHGPTRFVLQLGRAAIRSRIRINPPLENHRLPVGIARRRRDRQRFTRGCRDGERAIGGRAVDHDGRGVIGVLHVLDAPIHPGLKLALPNTSPAPDPCPCFALLPVDLVGRIAPQTPLGGLKPAAKAAPAGLARVVQPAGQKIEPRRRIALLHGASAVRRGPRFGGYSAPSGP